MKITIESSGHNGYALAERIAEVIRQAGYIVITKLGSNGTSTVFPKWAPGDPPRCEIEVKP